MDKSDRAIVSHIQRFSTEDGPGIRTTVFFQGCNLRCAWCHNPETWPMRPVTLFYRHLCTHCLQCIGACKQSAHLNQNGQHEFDRARCQTQGLCVDACPSDALAISGKSMDTAEIVAILMEDLPFMRSSGGGITLSGGEPLLQADACASIAKRCRQRGVHVLVDTAGCVPFSQFEKIIPFTDHFYFDLKAVNSEEFYRLTGGDFSLVLHNLKTLTQSDCPVTVRIPIIPGYNDDLNTAAQYTRLLKGLHITHADLLPFHRLGVGKYDAMGIEYAYQHSKPPTTETMASLNQWFRQELSGTPV